MSENMKEFLKEVENNAELKANEGDNSINYVLSLKRKISAARVGAFAIRHCGRRKAYSLLF